MPELDELEAKLDALTEADFRKGLEVFRGKLKSAEASYLNSCVHCGLCADSCHYHRAEPVLENMPAHKLEGRGESLGGKAIAQGKRRIATQAERP